MRRRGLFVGLLGCMLLSFSWAQPLTVTETIGPAGGGIGFERGAFAQLEPGFLLTDTLVQLAHSTASPKPTEPDGLLDALEPIGPRATLRLSLSAVDLSEHHILYLYVPPFEGADSLPYSAADVRVRLADGSEYRYLEAYVLNRPVAVNTRRLAFAFGETRPQVLEVSIQPVDFSRAVEE